MKKVKLLGKAWIAAAASFKAAFLMLIATIMLAAAGSASAHTSSVGYENAGPGSVTFWYGTYHPLMAPLFEGSFNLVGVGGNPYPSTTVSFTLSSGTKPAGLVDGTTNFYACGSTLCNSYSGTILKWQGVTFTGLAAGQYQFNYIPAVPSSADWSPMNTAVQTSTVTLTAALVGGAAPPANPIPNLAGRPGVTGVNPQPMTVLDLSGGQGPAMTNCLMGTVRSILGADAVYLEQNANGRVSISQGGRIISFYPLDASTDANQSADIHLTGSNVQNIGTSCGNFNIAPAIYNLIDFGAILNGAGLTAQIDAKGVITVSVAGTVYVARPDYVVTKGTPGTPSLVMGADGLYRFTDSAGNVQVLHPAFLDTDGLATQSQLALGMTGWPIIQLDGTALFQAVFGGQQFVLTPDLTLTAAPAANSTSYWWQDAPNHYMFRSNTLILAQGFSVRPVQVGSN